MANKYEIDNVYEAFDKNGQKCGYVFRVVTKAGSTWESIATRISGTPTAEDSHTVVVENKRRWIRINGTNSFTCIDAGASWNSAAMHLAHAVTRNLDFYEGRRKAYQKIRKIVQRDLI